MTKGIPLTPQELEEYERTFSSVDNLDKWTEPKTGKANDENKQPAGQIMLFDEGA